MGVNHGIYLTEGSLQSLIQGVYFSKISNNDMNYNRKCET